jgi:uncharacterized protein YajQ (UPF0234 family)
MPSFDIVNELNLMEVENAVNQTQKEIGQRFDFKGGKSDIELDKVGKKLKITADDDFKLRSIHQILEGKLVKRGVDLRILKYEKEIPASGNVIRQEVILRSGIEKEDAKEITKAIKDSKLKVQAQIQDEQVRVTAKSIDELQATMSMLRGKDMKTPLQFVNMRS